MIKTIIKRDGSIENFEPSKVNNWATWASATIKDRVDWSSIVMHAVKKCPDSVSSEELQRLLIKECVSKKSWPYSLMAGRLYASVSHKEVFDGNIPTVKEQHKKLVEMDLMIDMRYSDDEYEAIEKIIDHERDFNMAYFQIKQMRKKYSIADKVKNIEYETPQFIFMRMAMAIAMDYEGAVRLTHVENMYNHLSFCRVNAPTPNYMYLGTKHRGLASCVLYTTKDTAKSLAVGDHIAYTMTCMSAGIGSFINTRSLGDSVRGGTILHQGKNPYFAALSYAVKANIQAGRGGACTTYFSIFDPEVETFLMLQNPRTPVAKQNRNIHFAFMYNKLFAKKVALNEQYFTFNVYTAPDLMKLFFTDKQVEFEELYNKYDRDPDFKKTYLNARAIMLMAYEQRNEVATLYSMQIDEVNRHTSYKDPIYSSNLCLETVQPTKPYNDMLELYTGSGDTGEVSTCSLGGLVMSNIHDDVTHQSAAYYTLLMIDRCINMSYYPLPHVEFTAKNRMNAAVGMLGLAYHLARKNLKYDTPEGLAEIHKVSERHSYFLIKASLQLGKELGNAPWIDKTKWVDGWLPIDTYKKSIDQVTPHVLNYDWEKLRSQIKANEGIRNSSLIAHMPTESSSKASGAPNAIYPIRDLSLKKSDANNVLEWCAPDNDILEQQYQLAWEIDIVDIMKVYGVIQKFTDQSISADFYRDRSIVTDVTSEQLIEEFLAMNKYGVKTQYYQNSFTLENNALEVNHKSLSEVDIQVMNEIVENFNNNERGCSGGACTL